MEMKGKSLNEMESGQDWLVGVEAEGARSRGWQVVLMMMIMLQMKSSCVIAFHFLKDVMPQLSQVSILPIIISKLNNIPPIMFFDNLTTPHNTHEKNHSFFHQEDLFQSQLPSFNININPFDLRTDPQEINFDEVFSDHLPPNVSTISISTSSNKSYEPFDLSEDFLIDDFWQRKNPQDSMEQNILELQGRKLPLQELQETNKKNIIDPTAEKPTDKTETEDSKNCHDQTKNIPKNYIKAIFSFILQNSEYLSRLFAVRFGDSDVGRFIEYVKDEKRVKRYTIQRLKSLWLDRQNGKAMRIISFQFLRKKSLQYIFSSKIEKKMHHIKHRYKFIESISSPADFTNIK